MTAICTRIAICTPKRPTAHSVAISRFFCLFFKKFHPVAPHFFGQYDSRSNLAESRYPPREGRERMEERERERKREREKRARESERAREREGCIRTYNKRKDRRKTRYTDGIGVEQGVVVVPAWIPSMDGMHPGIEIGAIQVPCIFVGKERKVQ